MHELLDTDSKLDTRYHWHLPRLSFEVGSGDYEHTQFRFTPTRIVRYGRAGNGGEPELRSQEKSDLDQARNGASDLGD